MYKSRHFTGSSSKYESHRSLNLSGAAFDDNRKLSKTQGELFKLAGSGSRGFQGLSLATMGRFLSPYSPALAGALVKPRQKLPSLFGLGYKVLGDCSAT